MLPNKDTHRAVTVKRIILPPEPRCRIDPEYGLSLPGHRARPPPEGPDANGTIGW